MRGLRNSRAPISGFDSPSRASRAICRSCGGQIVARLDRPLAHRLAGRQQLTAGALGERLHADRRELVVRGAQLRTRVDPAILAAQPLAVEQVRAGELGPQPGAAQPLDRLAIQPLGGVARRSAALGERASMPSAKSVPLGWVVSASRSSASRASSDVAARARPPRRARAAPTSTPTARRCSRWLAGPPTPPPRSGRDRCRGPRPPSAPDRRRCPALRPRLARCALAIAAEASASLPCRAAEPQQACRARSGSRSPPPRSRLSAISEAAPAKSPDPRVSQAQRGEVDRQLRQRAGVANELDLSRTRSRACLRRPICASLAAVGQPAPPQDVLHWDAR